MATATIPAARTAPAVRASSTLAARLAEPIKAPAMLGAVGFATGILCSHFWWFRPGWLLVTLAAAFAISGVAARFAPRLAWFSVALIYALLGIACAEIAPAIDRQQELARQADNTPRVIEGKVIRLGPVRRITAASAFSDKTHEEQSQQIDVQIDSGLRSAVRVTLYAPVGDPFPWVSCGDRVRTTLAMHREERFLDPGVWDAGEYLLKQGIGALASTKPDKFAVTEPGQGGFACRLHSLQLRASEKLIEFADQPRQNQMPAFLRISRGDAAMLAAMITGDRSYLQRKARVGFERTGSFHLLVVSGLHLAIFSGLVFWLTRQVRLSRVWATLITIACSFGYAVFTGFGQPVERAFWMVTLYLAGRLLWRERVGLNVIGVVALVMLAADPGALFDSGFQMTLLSVLAIAGIAFPVAERTFEPYLLAMRNLRILRVDPSLRPKVAQFRVSIRMTAEHLRPLMGGFIAWKAFPSVIRFGLRVAELVVVSLAIESMMMLPMAAYFHRVTLPALPVNLLIVPLIGVLLPAALLTFVAVLVTPVIAIIPGAVTAAILHAVVWVVSFFGSVRFGDLRIPAPGATAVAAWIALTVAGMYGLRMRRFGLVAGAAALGLAAAIVVVPRAMARHAGVLEVTAIDVGQGDSLLVVSPEGKTLLIDAGGLAGASPESKFDIGEDVVSPVLWSRGIRRLDAVAVTHAHADHIGGMAAVLENFRPSELWVGRNPDDPQYGRLLEDAALDGTRIVNHAAGDTFDFGGTAVQVLAPERDYRPGKAPANNDSLVLRMSFGDTSALLEGDAEAPSEARMLAHGGLKSDLLKVGHHGSKTSTTPAFLSAVAPEWAAISVGSRNFYGHPRREVLDELQAAHVATYRTDIVGLTSFYLDGKHVTAQPWAAVAH